VRTAYKIAVETPEENGPFGTTTHNWEKNIKMDLGEIGCRELD
jgi:hypothetical protein